MTKSVSITVHPSDLSGEYLTVSDALHQVLDMIAALEGIEAGDSGDRRIVWRLTEAHTSSPPFTVTAEAFSSDPQVSIDLEAARVTQLYGVAIAAVLSGSKPDWLESEPGKALKRALKRNLAGVGHTDVVIGEEEPIIIVPATARKGVEALEASEDHPDDLQRTEYGTIECQVIGLTKYYSSPAIIVVERLSGEKVWCVLTRALAAELGPEHQWSEAWSGQGLRVGGKLTYGSDGKLKRINASFHETIEFADVRITDLKDIDITQGRTAQEHLDEFWGERFG